MNNKFASLGTALSRDEAKKVMGGKLNLAFDDGGGNKCNVKCSKDSDCDTTCPSCEKNTNWGDMYMCVVR
jgi:hypothetical protein